MNAEQTPEASTEQEWAEEAARLMWEADGASENGAQGWTWDEVSRPNRLRYMRHATALASLIEREREAARAEGMAAVAGPVLALADEWERDAADVAVLLDHDADELRESLLRESGALRAAAFILRAAIPTDATEALARLKAQDGATVADRDPLAEVLGGNLEGFWRCPHERRMGVAMELECRRCEQDMAEVGTHLAAAVRAFLGSDETVERATRGVGHFWDELIAAEGAEAATASDRDLTRAALAAATEVDR